MRMGVYLIRLSMRCPSGMSDSNSTSYLRKSVFQVSDLALIFIHLNATVKNSNSGGVVAAVLKPLQRVNKYRSSPAPAAVSHDSAHIRSRLNPAVYPCSLLHQPRCYSCSPPSSQPL